MIKLIDILREVSSLNSTTLLKPIPGYVDRGEVLLKKIEGEEPIALVNGDEIVINPETSSTFIDLLRGKKYKELTSVKFYDIAGLSHKLSELAKTQEFGSSKGIGGGAAQTALQESAQCLVLALRYHKGSDLTESDLEEEESLKDVASDVEVSEPIDKVIEFIENSTSWQSTMVSTANVVAGKYHKNYKFYRGKGIVTKIDHAAKKALSQAKVGLNINKWNPSDIWMATEDVNEEDFPEDIDELNDLLLELFREERLIGLSLKKCVSSCKSEVNNLSREANEKKKITYEGIRDKNENIFKAKDIYLITTKGTVQFRNFQNITAWMGEIKGEGAAGGKIGFEAINAMLTSITNTPLSSQQEVLTQCGKPSKEFINHFYKHYQATDLDPKVSLEEFTKQFTEAGLGSRTSNYFNMELLGQLDNLDKEDQDSFARDLFNYASSNTEYSSVFIKIS